MSETTFEDTLSQEIVGALQLTGGQLQVPDPVLLSVGKRIHESADKQSFATALIALATRLKDLPGSRPATNQVIALAAIALGDVALNGALCKALYSRGPG